MPTNTELSTPTDQLLDITSVLLTAIGRKPSIEGLPTDLGHRDIRHPSVNDLLLDSLLGAADEMRMIDPIDNSATQVSVVDILGSIQRDITMRGRDFSNTESGVALDVMAKAVVEGWDRKTLFKGSDQLLGEIGRTPFLNKLLADIYVLFETVARFPDETRQLRYAFERIIELTDQLGSDGVHDLDQIRAQAKDLK